MNNQIPTSAATATRIDVQFIAETPVQLEIKHPTKTFMTDQNKPFMPSLFHTAASMEDSSLRPATRPVIPLPLDNWSFSREKLERALTARFVELRKWSAAIAVSHVARQPFLRISKMQKKISGARPIQRVESLDVANAA